MYEGPQQDTDGVALPQQLDQASRSEKLQEAHVDGVHRLGRPSQREEGEVGGGGEKQGQTRRETQMAKIVSRRLRLHLGGRERRTKGNLEERRTKGNLEGKLLGSLSFVSLVDVVVVVVFCR